MSRLTRPRASSARRPRPAPRRFEAQLELLEDRRLLSAVPTLLKDIGTVTGSNPSQLLTVGSTLYFRAFDSVHGAELWKSDGTTGGTAMVADIWPGPSDSSPFFLTEMNGSVFFSASDAASFGELWKTDGTEAGTQLVKDIRPGTTGSAPSNLVNMGGTLYFAANDGTNGTELWKSDGSEAGTVMVKDIRPGNSSYPQRMTNVNGTLFFIANDGTNGFELWKSDGSEAGTVMVKDIRTGSLTSNPDDLINFNGTLYFAATDSTNGRELWKSDGSEAGTVIVKEITPGPDWTLLHDFTVVGSSFFFRAYQSGGGDTGLWVSDGTETGTVMLGEMTWYGNDSDPQHLTNVAGTLFFTANNGGGHELWKSDGTVGGTVLVKDIASLFFDAPNQFVAVGSTLYFTADDSANGTELWKSDGSEAGTLVVKDLFPGANSSSPSALTNFGGTLFFAASDGVVGNELWKTDGSEAGTQLVKDIYTSTSRWAIDSTFLNGNWFTQVGNTAYFAANDGARGLELWKTDGTTAGTVLVKDITIDGGSDLRDFTNVNGTLYFTVESGSSVLGRRLWKSDGTEAGTTATSFLKVADLVNVSGSLYFTSDDPFAGTGRELYWFEEGSMFFNTKDIFPGASSSNPRNLTNVNGTLYFFADDGSNGRELWTSDGTVAGTVLVKDIQPGAGGSRSSEVGYAATSMAAVGDTLFFVADDGTNGAELWKSNGTEAGTVLVKDIAAGIAGSGALYLTNANGTLIFSALNGAPSGGLWKSDGTEAGTVLVKELTFFGFSDNLFTVVGDTVFFPAAEADFDHELWKSNGTEAGTVRVKDINPGPDGSFPGGFGSGLLYAVNVNGIYYFWADSTGNFAGELWRSDGSEQGTVALPGPADPLYLTNLNGALLFLGFDNTHGYEPWVLEAQSLVTGRRLFYNNSIWDDPGFGFTNASAIAGDKTAYIPNGSNTSTFANMSSYTKGINGIMVELTGATGTLTADDFTIRMSGQGVAANNTPSTWAAAPAFTVTRVADTPTSGTDRYELVWPDGAITNRYVYVVVEGNDALGGNNTNTGLAASDYFFFGNKIGDVGSPEFYPNVNATDQVQVRNNQGAVAPPTGVLNIFDFNRDALIDASDQIIARNNQGAMPWLALTAPPSAPEEAPVSAAEISAGAGDDGSGSAVASALAAPSKSPDAAVEALADVLFADESDDAPASGERHLKMPAKRMPAIVEGSRPGDAADAAVDLALEELFADEELLDALVD